MSMILSKKTSWIQLILEIKTMKVLYDNQMKNMEDRHEYNNKSMHYSSNILKVIEQVLKLMFV